MRHCQSLPTQLNRLNSQLSCVDQGMAIAGLAPELASSRSKILLNNQQLTFLRCHAVTF